MRNHIAVFRFASCPEGASTRIGGRKDFDVGAARKMIRAGATIADIAEAQGLSPSTARLRLKKLGLLYLISDRQRRHDQCSAAGKASAVKAGA